MPTTPSIATVGATPRQRRLYLTVAALIAAVSAATLPIASMPLPAIPEFNLFYVSVVIVTELGTALLLFGQFRASRRLPLLVLAAAYLYTGCIVVPHLLYFSEFTTSLGVMSGKPQTAAWLWHFWHIGYPAAVLCFVLAEWRAGDVLVDEGAVNRVIAGTVAGVIALVLGLTATATVFHDVLPLLHDGRTWNPITYHLGWTMGGLTLAALVALFVVTRGRHVLHLWLMVALTAFFFDFTPNLLATERFAFGWYLGRWEAIMASGFLFVMLLTEMNRLYGNVAVAMQEASRLNASLEYRVKERTSDLEKANSDLRRALTEREFLIGEVYHRVNNNLQTVNALMSMERRRIDDPALREAFDRVSRRVHSMALVHRQLMHSDNLTEFDLAHFMADLAEHLRSALALDTRHITLSLDVDRVTTTLDVGMRIGLLVNELAGFAVEHSFPGGEGGGIEVSLRADAGSLELVVADDGVAPAAGLDVAGGKIVRGLVGQLQGTITTTSAAGTRHRVRIPLTAGEVAYDHADTHR